MDRRKRQPRPGWSYEKDWQAVVMQAATLRHWLAYHTYDSRRSTPGFPDCVFLRPPRLIIAELKKEGGKMTAAQKIWIEAFSAVPGIEAYCWMPSDWPEVDRVLR